MKLNQTNNLRTRNFVIGQVFVIEILLRVSEVILESNTHTKLYPQGMYKGVINSSNK
jgi:hypothetical protein